MPSTDYTQPPPKLVLDEFIAKALASTPPELHPFFNAFNDFYTRKWARASLTVDDADLAQAMAPAVAQARRLFRRRPLEAVPRGRLPLLCAGL